MKHSITRKITFIIISLVTGTVLLCWFLNTTLLEGYYVNFKQGKLQNALNIVYEAEKEDILYSKETNLELEKICEKDNITMMIMNAKSRVLFLVGGDEETYRQQFWEILFAAGGAGTEVLKEGESYTIGKYMLENYSKEKLLEYDKNPVLLKQDADNIFERVKQSQINKKL